MPKPTKRTSVTLMRDGVTFDQAVPGSRPSADFKLGASDARLVNDTASGGAKWIGDISVLTGHVLVAPTSFPGAVLLINGPGKLTWAITWGAGHQYLDGESVDYSFPSAVVARSALPDEIKSVTKKMLDARARVDRTSQPAGATMRDLGVDGNGEAVAQIEAKASIPGLSVGTGPVVVRAGASLNLPLAKSARGLLGDLAALHTLLAQPVLPGMEAVEQLVALRPKEPVVKDLEDRLSRALVSNADPALGIGWPEERLAPRGVLESVKVAGVGDGKKHNFDTVPEVDQVRGLFVGAANVSDRLRSISLTVHNENPPTASSQVSQSVPLRRWLSYEVKDGARRFCLYDGDWYRMDDKYLDQIDLRVAEILAQPASIALPPWPTAEEEKDYNPRAATAVGGVVLDRKLISTPLHSKGGTEPCDIYVPDGVLIHVKRGKSSSSVSHLLAQALVSADAMARDEYARKAWANRLTQLTGSPPADPTPKEVILAIGRPSPISVNTLFTFSKVNLVRQYDTLRFMDVRVRVAWIPEK